MLFKKKPAVTPSLEDQVATAIQSADTHLTAFESAATGLEQTATALDLVRDTAAEQATRHLAVKVEADSLAFKHRAKAQKIRDLIG